MFVVHKQATKVRELDRLKPFSIQDIVSLPLSTLSSITFKPNAESDCDEEKYFSIKRKHMGDQKVLVQIVDITDAVTRQHIKLENESLSVLNACVSHELRNPLNSIAA